MEAKESKSDEKEKKGTVGADLNVDILKNANTDDGEGMQKYGIDLSSGYKDNKEI